MSDVRYRLHQRLQEIGRRSYYDILTIITQFSGVPREAVLKFHSMAPISYAFYEGASNNSITEIKRRKVTFDREILDLGARPKACPQCVQSDLQDLGLSYWHRTHQIPGAIYCPHHDQRLIFVSAQHPYYCQPHHLIFSQTPDHSAYTVNREFHDRMMRIWMLILKRDKQTSIYSGMKLLSAVYGYSYHDLSTQKGVWDLARTKLESVSRSYGPELSRYLDEIKRFKGISYRTRLLVAALAASDVEIHYVDQFFDAVEKWR